MTGIVFRDLAGMAEFRAAEDLQRDVWGHDDPADPADLMMVIQAEGGLCAGAFRGSLLIGYVFGFPTRDAGVQHSHRLAVHPKARGQHLGAALKWHQRDWCIAQGITLVRWTFDPLRLPNAILNIATLGAVGCRYHPDYYGPMAGINAGAPSDRLLAEWVLNAPGVVARAQGLPPPPITVTGRIALHPDFGALLTRDPHAAHAERLRQRAEMTTALARGDQIAGLDRAQSDYLLARPSVP